MKPRTHFYDPLYDFVTFEEAEREGGDSLDIFHSGFSDSIRAHTDSKNILPFLNAVEFNRLNFLRQSGFAFLVFPSSTHTRFSHSIGSSYLGFMACGRIIVQEEERVESQKQDKREQRLKRAYLGAWLEERGLREEFLLALLLHDLGHFPFSHTLESDIELWQCINEQERVTHEKMTCRLIMGSAGEKPGENDYEQIRRSFLSGCPPEAIGLKGWEFVSDIIDRSTGVDRSLICYFISGDPKYRSHIGAQKHLELKVIHALVSGLLDLDRVDHYRRDSYFSGLKFGSNLNFPSLLSGMTLHYYTGGSEEDYELRLSSSAIGHALTLLHSKERLAHDCFEDPRNVAYDAMLHRALNIHLGVDDFEERKCSEEERARLDTLLMLTDDELLSRLSAEGSPKVRNIIFRIRNRRPYFLAAKRHVNSKKYTIKGLRKALLERTNLSADELVFRPAKAFGSTKRPSDEWLNLDYLCSDNGDSLMKLPDYSEQIRYYKQVQTQSPDIIWFFVVDETRREIVRAAIEEELPSDGK